MASHLATELHLFGLNHRGASVEIRERFALTADRLSWVLETVKRIPKVREVVAVSTCNRIELIVALHHRDNDGSYIETQVEQILAELAGLTRAQFADALYKLRGTEVVTHLFRVAAGIDSLIVGEPQILGQLKAAYDTAFQLGRTSFLLNRLFHRTFGVAKSIRTRTKIGHNAVSVCYAACELAKQIFGDLGQASVMLIGAGDVGTLALKHFSKAGCKKIFIVNKTLTRAIHLADEVQGVALELAQLGVFLPEVDIVIGASTLSPGDEPLVSADQVRMSLGERPGRTQFFIDLGVPRNFDQAINDVPDAFLYNVDDLEQVVRKNLDARAIEVHRAEVIVSEEVQKFVEWYRKRSIEPLIRALWERCDQYESHEVQKTLQRLRREGFSPEQCAQVERALSLLCRALTAKVVHQPIRFLKDTNEERELVEALFQAMFFGADQSEVSRSTSDGVLDLSSFRSSRRERSDSSSRSRGVGNAKRS